MQDSIFDKIIDTVQDCIFWKDNERRFVGVNQAFLDFYGFKSADILIGKTDEDMGWHSDPEPFRQDELRVLNGESTYKVHGKCIVRGEERDIIASKVPVYEGDEIVGLVGSFVDVTDLIKRDNLSGGAQVMYTRDQLRKYPYFDKMLDDTPLEEILDSLTGVLARRYMLDFVRSLIASDTPFTFAMVDLDNFKTINDSYGHHAGDVVLMDVAKNLALYNDEIGVVGRYGGDELMIVNLRDREYDDKKSYYEGMYAGMGILRKAITLGDAHPFITATIGSATYPDDATEYDGLFELIDKTLYRGKSKGRNCYIIYVEAKHKDLDIKKLGGCGIYTTMRQLISKFEKGKTLPERLAAIIPVLQSELQISDLYYVNSKGRMRSVLSSGIDEDVSDIRRLSLDDVYAENTLENIERPSPRLYEAIKRYEAGGVIIARLGFDSAPIGYLIGIAPRKQRIWQENDLAVLYFASSVVSAYMHLTGEELP